MTYGYVIMGKLYTWGEEQSFSGLSDINEKMMKDYLFYRFMFRGLA